MADHYSGRCLCGAIAFEARAPAGDPHTCSCKMCQRHSGAPITAWVEFPADAVRWTGPGGAPALWRSSDASSRAFCATCGSSIGAVDDAPCIALMLGAFDEVGQRELAPSAQSHPESSPDWLHVRLAQV